MRGSGFGVRSDVRSDVRGEGRFVGLLWICCLEALGRNWG